MKFYEMSNYQLRVYINGCHHSKDYGADFDAACRELNSRITKIFNLK